MEEVAAFVFQVLIEVGLQLLGGLGVDWATTRREGSLEEGCSGPGWFALFGGLCGGLSLVFVPNLLLPNLTLRLLNLALAPLLAGWLSYLVAANLWATRRNRSAPGRPRQHFWRGFWFALAFGAVRFAYAHR